MSQTTSTQGLGPTFIFEVDEWNLSVRPFMERELVAFALSFTLYGMYVLLCGASIYSLVQLNSRNRQTTLVLSLALLVLFTSTTIYTVVTCLQKVGEVFTLIVHALDALWAISSPSYASWPYIDFNGAPTYNTRPFLSCAPTATLTVNIILGDAIVCWRACTLWWGNRCVMGACLMLLLTTFALGTVDTIYSCRNYDILNSDSWQPDPHADGTGSLYEGFSYGVAATALSLTTNLFATIMVAMKAWISRRMLKRYVVTGPMVSQMEKVLSLLVESGMIYCALWVVVLAWQAGIYKGNSFAMGNNNFWTIFTVIMDGTVVPLIAIYPTVIIVVVALNRSHIENGFTKTSQSSVPDRLPMRPLAVAVNTTVATRCDGQLRERSDKVLLIGEQDFQPGDAPDGSSVHSAAERKLEEVV